MTLITGLIFFYTALQFALLFGIFLNEIDIGLAWLNPLWLYRHINVNWFGAFFIALVGTLMFIPFAVGYWLYKACTVGRK